MTTRWARLARGLIAAIVSLFVAACSHALAGGALPATAGLALCLAFSGAACVLLAGKTLSLARLSAAVALSQLLFHGLFSLLADAPLSTPSSAEAGMHHGGAVALQLATATATVPPMSADADLRMWLGHAFGAIVTVAVLSLGERAFWALARLARLFISCILDVVLPVETAVSARLSRSDRPAAVIPHALIFSIHRHRGPPTIAIAP
jgi:hypothetical protein